MSGNFSTKQNKVIHTSFTVGLIIKGIDGLFEIIGGVLLLFLNPARMNRIIQFLTQHELSEDPKDVVANALIRLSSNFSIDAQSFGVFYLMSHGIIKCLIIFLLWRKKLWAYPVSILSLLLFICYQLYRYTIDHSFGLILLTIFDFVMIVVTLLEYRRMKSISYRIK